MVGMITTIFLAQYDSWTHKKIVTLLQKIAQESLGGTLSCSVRSVNFFAPSIVLSNIEMNCLDGASWQWRCKKCEVSCSWLQLLFKGILDQHITIDGYECRTTTTHNSLAIESHLQAMMNQPFVLIPVQTKSVVFKNGCLQVDHDAGKNQLKIHFNSSSLCIGKQVKTTMSVTDGQLVYDHNQLVEKITTDLSFVTEYTNRPVVVGLQIGGTFMLPHMGNQGSCYITGSWHVDHGRFSIRNAYNSFFIDPIIITPREFRLNGRFPLSYAMQCIRNSYADQMIEGSAYFTVKIARDDAQKIEGQLVVEDVKMSQHHICDTGKVIFERQQIDDDWKMRLMLNRYNQECKGTGYWNATTRYGELVIKNSTDLGAKAFPYWRIKHNNFLVHLKAEQDLIASTYEMIVTNTLTQATHTTQGSFSYSDGILQAEGMLDTNEFITQAQIYPQFVLHDFLYKNKEQKPLITLSATDDKNYVRGSIAFPFIRSMLNSFMHYDVQGEGNIDIFGQISPQTIVADLALRDATIRLPQTYNFIDGFSARCIYDTASHSIVFENSNLSLHTGKLSCLYATMHFNDTGHLTFMRAPVLIDRCLLNIKKDLFALVSGSLLFSKDPSVPAAVTGHLIIDKAQLKENLFSGIIQKQLLSYAHSAFSLPDFSLGCDLSLETKSAICVDTGFFQTNAQLNLRIKKEKQDPSVTGSIALHSGTLNFPYKPLYISKGIITFSPEHLFDPHIELIARNKIKKYDVSLQVEGTLLTHHIQLDATPPLSEEQIVGLLLVGSEENSLNSMMPALIVQNLKNLIFSNNQLSFFDKYFKPLLGTLNINLVPSFTDQTGRGGLRGAIEITVEDRWRALIQKNFSLTEDTKFELDFLFSDDITLRVIRDERRDLGGEVEMRWKF